MTATGSGGTLACKELLVKEPYKKLLLKDTCTELLFKDPYKELLFKYPYKELFLRDPSKERLLRNCVQVKLPSSTPEYPNQAKLRWFHMSDGKYIERTSQ